MSSEDRKLVSGFDCEDCGEVYEPDPCERCGGTRYYQADSPTCAACDAAVEYELVCPSASARTT